MQHNDLKFFTNEPERDLYSRFATILKSNTNDFVEEVNRKLMDKDLAAIAK